MRCYFFWVALMLGMSVSAQSEREWETYLNEVMTIEDVGTAAWEEMYEQLCELDLHPIDLNRASREQLEGLSLSVWAYEIAGRVANDPFVGLSATTIAYLFR